MDSRPVLGAVRPIADRRWARRFTRGRGAAALLVLAMVIGGSLRYAVEHRNASATADTFPNLLIAKSILGGRGFSTGGSEHPDLSRSVMFPLSIAAVAPLAGGVESAAQGIVLLAGAMIVIPLFYAARTMYGPRAALAALPLGAASCLVAASATLLPTPLFLLFAVTALTCAWLASRRRSAVLWVATGLASGAAALTRPEGLALPLVFVAWSLLARDRGKGRPRSSRWRRLKPAALVVAASALLYAPYAMWTSVTMGRFAFAPGIEYLQAMRTVSDRLGLREVRSQVPWTERARFTLTADHRALYLETYFLTGSFPSVDRDVATAPPAQRRVSPIEYWEGVARRRRNIVIGNLLLAPRKALWSHFLTPLIAALATVGVVASARTRRGRQASLLLGLFIVGSMAPLTSHVEARFLFPPYAAVLIVAAAGWGVLARTLVVRTSSTRAGRALRLLPHALVVTAISLSGFKHEGRDPAAGDRAALLQHEAASLGEGLPPGRILAIAPNFPYWSGRDYRPIPAATATGILDYARAQGATSLVLEEKRDLAARPDLGWLTASGTPSGFRLVRTMPHPNGGSFLIFELNDDPPAVP